MYLFHTWRYVIIDGLTRVVGGHPRSFIELYDALAPSEGGGGGPFMPSMKLTKPYVLYLCSGVWEITHILMLTK